MINYAGWSVWLNTICNDIILYHGKSVPLRVHDQESHIGILGCFPTYKGNKWQ